MIRRSMAAFAATLGVATVLASSATADAAPPPAADNATVEELAAQWLAQDQGLSLDEARERIQQQDELADIAEAVEAAVGDAAAGSYLDEESGAIVVNVTDEGAAVEVSEGGATPKVVEYSEAQLDETESAVQTSLGEQLVSSYVDPVTNTVVASVAPEQVDSAQSQLADKPVTVVATSGEITTQANVYGGQQIEYTGYACSLGFNGTRAGTPVFITAGHCARNYPAYTRNGVPLGQAQAYSFPGNDYAYATLNPDWTGMGGVDMYNGYATPVTGYSNAPVGTTVCKSGRTTGWTCGTVQAKNVTVNYGAEGSVGGLTQTNACTEGGDSGGSWMAGNLAQGVTSGGASYNGLCGEKVGQPNQSFFQPVDEILAAYGITLNSM